jgi:hypothetical protein
MDQSSLRFQQDIHLRLGNSMFYGPLLADGIHEQIGGRVAPVRLTSLPGHFTMHDYHHLYRPRFGILANTEKPSLKRARECTQPLREWLCSHKDNPYPSKQEKMWMACITGLSLTQVSMWFANARRRIKKLGMKAWSKGRCEDEDVSIIVNQNQRQSGPPSNSVQQETDSK